MKSHWVKWALILIVGLFAMNLTNRVFLSYLGDHGVIYTSSDSYSYIAGARGLLTNGRYEAATNSRELQTSWPPMFSALIAAAVTLKHQPNLGPAAMIVLRYSLVLTAILAFSFVIIISESVAAAMLFTFAIIMHEPLLWSATRILSEGPFILFHFSWIFGLTLYLQTKRLLWLLFSGVACGMSVMTRSIGVLSIFMTVFILGLPFIRSLAQKVRHREFMIEKGNLTHAMVFFCVAAVPFAIWSVNNIINGFGFRRVGQNVAYYTLTDAVMQACDRFGFIFGAGILPKALGLCFGITSFTFAAIVIGSFASNAAKCFAKLVVMHSLFYTAGLCLVCSYTNVDSLTVNSRFLLPATYLMAGLMALALSWLTIHWRSIQFPPTFKGVATLLLSGQLALLAIGARVYLMAY